MFKAYIPIAGRFYSITEDGFILESKYIEYNGKRLSDVLSKLLPGGQTENATFDLLFTKGDWDTKHGNPRFRVRIGQMNLKDYTLESVYMKELDSESKEYKSVVVEKRLLCNNDIVIVCHQAFDGLIRFKK